MGVECQQQWISTTQMSLAVCIFFTSLLRQILYTVATGTLNVRRSKNLSIIFWGHSAICMTVSKFMGAATIKS
jgi:hypothetical protein